MLHDKIKDELKKSMLAKDALRTSVLRGIIAALMNEHVAKNKKPSEKMIDEETLAIIRRLAKQRKDSMEQFKAGGRQDLVDSETAELKILEAYLPQMMSKDEIRKVAEKKKEELGISDKAKSGQLTGAVMKELKGKADGGDVKEVVEAILGK